MTTQRKSTGASALIDIMKEVYETKLRMKEVINQKIETNSDDFEEYATLAHNAIVAEYNRGIGKGYAAGWHAIFPSDQVTEDMYEEYYHSYNTYTPSIPTYTTETDVDNLLVMMQDNKRCRLLLKSELSTNSDEFVTYPDLLEALYVSSYNSGYTYGYEQGFEAAKQIGVLITQDFNTITMSSEAVGTIHYYFNDDYMTVYEYDGPFLLEEDCIIHAYINQYQETIYEFIAPNWADATDMYIQAMEEGDYRILIKRYEADDPAFRVVHLNKYEYHKLAPNVYVDAPPIDDANCDGLYSIYGYHQYAKNNWLNYTKLYDAYNYKFISSTDTTFEGCINLTRPGKFLPEPSYGGYYISKNMFKGCTSLLVAPKIQHSWITSTYIDSMFEGCTSLIDISELDIAGYPTYGGKNIFKGCTSLIDIRNLDLTGWNYDSKESMFEGCTSLIYGPIISSGAKNMFKGCTSLLVAPVCNDGFCPWGESMFEGCTSLVTAPDMYPTSINTTAFKNMFKGCTSLVTAPDIYINIDQNTNDEIFDSMFDGCTSLTKAPDIYSERVRLPQTFKGCTSLVNPPIIATKYIPVLTETFKNCYLLTKSPCLFNYGTPNYNGTFENCNSLNHIEMLASNITSSTPIDYLNNWVKNVSSSGTFIKNAAVTIPSGNSGIPNGWTVENDSQCITFYSDNSFTLGVYSSGLTTNWNGTIQYSTNLTDWYDWYGRTTLTAVNDGTKYKLHIRGSGNTIITGNDVNHRWVLTGTDVYCKGVLGSLLNKTDPLYVPNLQSHAFAYMFYGCTCLKSTPWLYSMDINGVNNISGKYIYSHMFEGCTGLTEVSDLPALTLTEGCYEYMFKDCTSLTTAPKLPALTLTEKCYQYMFNGCTSLNYIKMIATDISASNSMTLWVENVADDGTFIKQRNMNSLPTGSYGIPINWTVAV